MLHEHGEGVAADAGEGVAASNLPAQQLGELLEQQVTRRVAPSIVDGPETIHVHVAESMLGFFGAGGIENALQALQESLPIDEPGESVVTRQVRHAALQVLLG